MFSLVSKNSSLAALVIISVLSLLWVVDGVAKGVNKKSKGSLPHVEIKTGADLASDGREASKKQIPVLMFFSMKHCGYCIEVEEDYLKPMLRNSSYDNKVIIRKIKIDSADTVRDFAGKEHYADDFGDIYNISMVPTVILVDSKGKKIAPPIIGIASSNFYSHDLDKAIKASTQKIRTLAKR